MTTGRAREGLLLGRPAQDGNFGRASWVLYESGSIVIRRSPEEDDVVDAALYHLTNLAQLTSAGMLPLNLRTFLMPDGSAWLVDPIPIYDLPGLDRRLLRRGVTVLPSTVVALDAERREIVLPEESRGLPVPSGRLPVGRVLLRHLVDTPIEAAESFLAVARVVVRTADTDLANVLTQIELLEPGEKGPVEMLETETIKSLVEDLALGRR